VNHTKEIFGHLSSSSLDVGTGLFYSRKDFYLGISFLHITKPDFGLAETSKIPQELHLSTGYKFKLNSNYHIVPSLQINRTNGVSYITPTLLGAYKNRILLGFSCQNMELLSANIGTHLFDRFLFFASCGMYTDKYLREFGFISYIEGGLKLQIGKYVDK